jgi:hypothetical protein
MRAVRNLLKVVKECVNQHKAHRRWRLGDELELHWKLKYH